MYGPVVVPCGCTGVSVWVYDHASFDGGGIECDSIAWGSSMASSMFHDEDG